MNDEKNSFLDYSNPVTGSSFVGRKEDLDLLILRCKKMLGSSITGIPKIGKTSLAREALRRLREDNFVCAEVSLENVTDRAGLYKKIIRSCMNALEPSNWLLKNFHRLKFHKDRVKLRNAKLSGDDMCVYFQEFVSYHFPSNSDKPKLVLLFDDFDKIRDHFNGAVTCMGDLRDFSQNHMFSFILTARRTMRMLEERTDNSTLAATVHQFDLRPLSQSDFSALLGRSSRPVTPQVEKEIWDMTSGHPYLTSYMLFLHNKGDSFSHDNIRHFFSTYYQSIHSMFDELDLYQKFRFLAIFGILHLTTTEKEEFEKYGLLIRNGNTWNAFSQDYDDFLQNENLSVPLMDTLGKTERRFRTFICQQLSAKNGVDWFSRVPDDCIDPKSRQEISDRYNRTLNKYPGAENRLNVLDFSYFPHLSALLSHYWTSVFRPILGDDKKKITRIFDKLIDPRNKEAHGLNFLLSPKDVQEYNQLCDELNSFLDKAGIDEDGYASLTE